MLLISHVQKPDVGFFGHDSEIQQTVVAADTDGADFAEINRLTVPEIAHLRPDDISKIDECVETGGKDALEKINEIKNRFGVKNNLKK